MSVELIGLLGVAVALAALIATVGGLVLASHRSLRVDLVALMATLEQRMTALEQRMTALEQRMTALEQRMARVEGVLEGAGLIRTVAAAATPETADE